MKRFFIFLCLLLCVCAPALAEGRVIDDAGLLSAQEEQELNETIAGIADAYQADVVLLLQKSIGGRDAKMYAADYYDEHGFGQGEDKDGLLFLLAMSEREYATVTTGDAVYAFSDWTLDQIHADVTPYLSRGEYAEAFRRYLRQVSDILRDFRKEEASYSYYVETDDYGVVHVYRRLTPFARANRALPVIAVVAFVIALIVAFSLKAQMKSVRRKNTADSYVKDGSFNLTRIQDIYLYTTTARRKIEQEPPPGGGHGGHGGGSTTFHGSSGTTHGGRSGHF